MMRITFVIMLCTVFLLLSLSGHGTYEEQGFIYAAIAGVVEVVDKLVYVRPLRNSK